MYVYPFFFVCVQECQLIETSDQDLTDYTKCLAIMVEEIQKRQLQVTVSYSHDFNSCLSFLCDVEGIVQHFGK